MTVTRGRAFPNAAFSGHSRAQWNTDARVNVAAADHDRRKYAGRSFNRYDPARERVMMTKTLTAIAAAGVLTVATLATPQPAQAHYHGGGVAAGIIGGLAAGAIIGAAVNGPYYGGYYGPGYYYAPGPAYYGGPSCYWTHRRFWDGWGWHVRRVRVCD
jgi:hypothetical protein